MSVFTTRLFGGRLGVESLESGLDRRSWQYELLDLLFDSLLLFSSSPPLRSLSSLSLNPCLHHSRETTSDPAPSHFPACTQIDKLL